MDEYKSSFEDKRILIIYIIVIIAILTGVTYALQASSVAFNLTTGIVRIDEDAYGDTSFDSSNIKLVPILDSEVETRTDNVIKIEFTVGGASTNTAERIIYDLALVDLKLDCDLLSEYLKWKVVNEDTGTEIATGSFSYTFDTITNGRLVLTNTQIELPDYNANKTGYHNYVFYIWLSDSCQESSLETCKANGNLIDQSNLMDKQFSGKVEVELYTENPKALVRNPSNTLPAGTCINNYQRINRPNLDDGNLIPVYYDEATLTWKKADSTNSDDSWYNYDEKRWANAILVSDSTKRSTYQEADPETEILDEDISAFFVWIPRFKYQVWNINRQGTAETSYAYPAYTYGINIKWESNTESTGNVSCTYNISNTEGASNLSDKCIYNGTDLITTSSVNSNYADAWYTHPAFTFGDVEKKGFWIGKFETSGTATAPTIIPDKQSLRSQTLSKQFTTAIVFQSFGLSSDVNVHMLTNLEWGAVAYLSHSIYGLCDGTNSCTGVYHNNSTSHYTGRSSGKLSKNSTTSTNGTYEYRGMTVGTAISDVINGTATVDITKVASTTRNVTGVYDLSGGSHEYVMGNMVKSGGAFNASSSGTSWNGSSTLASKYYNAYSYGTSYNAKKGYNRARLGDATAEVLGGTATWQPGSGITNSLANFPYYTGEEQHPWFARGGAKDSTNGGPFYFNDTAGGSSENYSFRVSIS